MGLDPGLTCGVAEWAQGPTLEILAAGVALETSQVGLRVGAGIETFRSGDLVLAVVLGFFLQN